MRASRRRIQVEFSEVDFLLVKFPMSANEPDVSDVPFSEAQCQWLQKQLDRLARMAHLWERTTTHRVDVRRL